MNFVSLISNALIAFVAILHLSFLVLEMFFWTKPLGLRVFRQTLQTAEASATLAANQGLYNGFLAGGLIWGLLSPQAAFARDIQLFFLSCVIIAGCYGGWSAHRRIFWIQAFPALVAILLLLTNSGAPS